MMTILRACWSDAIAFESRDAVLSIYERFESTFQRIA